jgi:glutathione S-transferase
MLSSFPALVSVLALLLYIGVFVAAGRVRARYGIEAPATGAPEFERALRVQQNTLEQLICETEPAGLAIRRVSCSPKKAD